MKLEKNNRFNFITTVLLNEIINYQRSFSTLMMGDDKVLVDHISYMKHNQLLAESKGKYIPTEKGRNILVGFFKKYFEFLRVFDIFCAVDLGTGEFAFSKTFESNDDEWKVLLVEERFSDVRVAVAEFKGIDPMEIVFMSFLNENKFFVGEPGWQNNLVTDAVWHDIEDIVNTAISLEELKDKMEDIVTKGSEVMLSIAKQEDENKKNEVVEETTTTTVETVEEDHIYYVPIVDPFYYDYNYCLSYASPYYISPIWAVDLFVF